MTRFEWAPRGMAQRVDNLIRSDGAITFPAVPALVEHYVEKCAAVFAGLGRRFNDEELGHLRGVLTKTLAEAYAFSQRSTITVTYRSQPAGPLNYSVTVNAVTMEQVYEGWIVSREGSLFGSHPDARVLNLAEAAGDPASYQVLDIGAGTGRNALALARLGHPVDAAEPTAHFASIIRTEAQRDALNVRVIERDVFGAEAFLRSDYSMILLSGVVSDFRRTEQLREVFELAARCLSATGSLVFNIFIAHDDYSPDEAARQFAQQSYSSFFTRAEIAEAAAGLPVELVADDSVYEYECAHLPDGVWPPTGWYVNWVTGRDVFGADMPTSPIELRWLIYRRTE